MSDRNSRMAWTRRVFQTTPAGLSTQVLAIAALVAIPAAILAALPGSQAPRPDPAPGAARQFTLACTRTWTAAACGCAATSIPAVIGRDAFREAVLRNAGNIFGDRAHSATAHRMIDACVGVPLPTPPAGVED
jgi:hypothetical protein